MERVIEVIDGDTLGVKLRTDIPNIIECKGGDYVIKVDKIYILTPKAYRALKNKKWWQLWK